MTKFKRILSGVLATALLLSGCSSENSGKDGASATKTSTEGWEKGAYVGKNVTPEELSFMNSMSAFKKLTDGKIVAYDYSMTQKIESADNAETWQKSDGPGKQFVPESDDIKAISDAETLNMPTIDENGVVYSVFGESSNTYTKKENWKLQLKKITTDGTISDLVIKQIDELNQAGESIELNKMISLAPDKLYIQFVHGAVYEQFEENGYSQVDGGTSVNAVFNPETGEKLYDLPEDLTYGNADIVTDKENLYYLSALNETAELVVANLQSGAESKRLATTLSGSNSYNSKIAISDTGKIYIANNDGIYEIDKESSELKLKAKGSKLPLGNPDYYASTFMALSDEEFLSYGYGDSAQELWRYYYDPEASYNPNAVLTIWTLTDSDYSSTNNLQYLTSAFLQQHPEADINIETGIVDTGMSDSSANIDEAIKQLNTRLLTGEAPDILLLDGTPISKYAKEGLLLNLDGKVDTSDMYGTFGEQMKTEKGLFYVPTTFSFYTLVTDDQEIIKADTYEKWMTLLQNSAAFSMEDFYANPDAYLDPSKTQATSETEEKMWQESYNLLPEKQPVLALYDFQSAYDTLWSVNELAIIEDSKINEENLKTFMAEVKLLAEKNKIFESAESIKEEGYDPFEYFDRSFKLGSGYLESISESQYASKISKAKIAGVTQLYQLDEIGNGIMTWENNEQPKAHPDEQFLSVPSVKANGTWNPGNILGVSSQSKHQDLATEFVQFSLSTSMQAKLARNSLPIVKSAIPALIEKTKADYEKMLEQYPQNAEEYKVTFGATIDMDGITAKLTTPLITDNVIRKQAWEPVLDYSRGKISEEEAISKIHDLTKIYLGEKAQ
ncbi:extracellular solute-binding protein [Scatolibacter rhodanostii]|uniref:extracellular solute-binding protein n=1 Tax=Scatolibacter rhodanostii TaxID=2014781 RepID=UPI000C08CE3F|nr:extracellular solute-binding protein [Scatolibacter rhodanostii]